MVGQVSVKMYMAFLVWVEVSRMLVVEVQAARLCPLLLPCYLGYFGGILAGCDVVVQSAFL